MDPIWFISGKGEPFLTDYVNGVEVVCERYSEHENPGKHKVVDFEHDEAIKRFENKDLAKEVNEHLFEIERLNLATFKEACAYIKGIAVGLKSMVEYDRRQGERRRNLEKDRELDKERRVEDRRKASGE